MKLKPDCTRDILIAIEDVVDLQTKFVYTPGEKAPDSLKNYSPDEIAYHIRQCDLSGFLIGCEIFCYGGLITVQDLTPAGHEFLANTRKNSIWEKVKEIGDEVGSDSLKSLAEIARQVIVQLIRSKFPII